jgi:hypothetical protein
VVAEGSTATRSEAMVMARVAREAFILMIIRVVTRITRVAMARTGSCTSSGEASPA